MAANNKGRGGNQERGNTNDKGTRSNTSSKGTSKRGFGSMDEDQQREISRKGDESSHGGGRSSNQGSSRSNLDDE